MQEISRRRLRKEKKLLDDFGFIQDEGSYSHRLIVLDLLESADPISFEDHCLTGRKQLKSIVENSLIVRNKTYFGEADEIDITLYNLPDEKVATRLEDTVENEEKHHLGQLPLATKKRLTRMNKKPRIEIFLDENLDSPIPLQHNCQENRELQFQQPPRQFECTQQTQETQPSELPIQPKKFSNFLQCDIPDMIMNNLQMAKYCLFKAIPQNEDYHCVIQVVNYMVKPQYLLYSKDLKILMSAEVQSGSIGSNIYFFVGEPKIKNSKEYVGKLRGNMMNTSHILYSKGLPAKDTKNLSMIRTELANFTNQSPFESESSFKIHFPHPSVGQTYFKTNRQSLKTIHKIDSSKIIELLLKRQAQNKYKQGKLINTNFQSIVQSQRYGKSFTLKKKNDTLYEASFSSPMSFYQGFALAITCITSKHAL